MSHEQAPHRFNIRRAPFIIVLILVSALPLSILIIFPEVIKRFDETSYLGLLILTFINSSGTLTAGVPIPIPGMLLIFLAARVLNPWYVGLISGVGSGLGEAFSYPMGTIGNMLIGESKVVIWLKSLVSKYGGVIIFIGAAIPNPLFDLWGLAAGLTNYSFRKFLIIVLFARIIRSMLVSFLGYYFAFLNYPK
jgi:membrane protein YqaA with SNARE-associated domain